MASHGVVDRLGRVQKKTGKLFEKQGVDDLVMMPKIDEASIADNIKKRYMNDLIYTNVGPVLISVNPYKPLGIETEEYVNLYRGRFRHELPPHVYALAEETFRNMKGENLSQCVIISGESGAGKTEAAKMIMRYISAVSGGGEEIEYTKQIILESNPLLEAFGNAKTLRNNNSSRFGKYFEIKFNREYQPYSGEITHYLLEKSRVVFQTPGERNFHAFYQLLVGASDKEAQDWQLYSPEHFYYVNQSATYTVQGIDDKQEWVECRAAMAVCGLDAATQSNIYATVAGVLHLGNIHFGEDAKGNGTIGDQNILQLAASLLSVDTFTLQSALLFRVVTTGGGPGGRSSTYNVPQNPAQAAGNRDALAKVLYSRMFDFIVAAVNRALDVYKHDQVAVIGVLDIFGFEIFEHNGFEQFCINFVNEKLQQYFIELTLKAEQEEYNAEGIKWTPIDYFNNQIVCDLIEGKRPPGIFSILDDTCYAIHAQSDGTDVKFLGKISGAHGNHAHYRGYDGNFSVKHYAGEVCYEVEGFSDKNKDTLFNDLIEAMQCSQNDFIVGLFPENTQTAGKKRPTTAGFKIKTSCGALMKELSTCEPHYVRCMKPNENKAAHDWDSARCKHQIQYLGLLENVRVRRAGFAYRAEFARFLRRYKKLSRKTWGLWGEWTGDAREGCSVLLSDLNLDETQWQLGKTKVFIRHPETLFHIEELLERFDYACAVRLQTAWKKWKLLKHALEQKAAVSNIFKGKKERQRGSVGRLYIGDYMNYADNFPLHEVIQEGENVIFADQIIKLNRRSKPERRDFVITDKAVYFVMRKKKKGAVYYQLTRRTDLSNLTGVSVSSLQDNYIVLHVPSEYDNLFENDKKTEICAILMEYTKYASGRDLNVTFADSISYTIKTKDKRQLNFRKDEGCPQAVVKKSGKALTICIASGMPKDTDSTPKAFSQRGQTRSARPAQTGAGGGGAPRGGGGGGGGGGGAPRGGGGGAPAGGGRGAAAPAAARAAAAPARGRGGPAGGGRGGPAGGGRGGPAGGAARGGGAPRGGGRGGPRGGGRGGPRGGGGRGGPARGGAAGGGRGGPARGGGRGGPRGGRGGPAAGRGRGGGAPPVSRPSRPTARCLYDYDAATDDELSFKENDVIFIVQKDSGGWWEGELNGKRGWVPANYVQEVK